MKFVVLTVVPDVLFLGLCAAAFRAPPEHHGTARALRRIALLLSCGYAGLVGMFVLVETFQDPGGWRAAELVTFWLVPLAGLALWGWYRPAAARRPLAAAAGAVVSVNVWYALDPAVWHSIEWAHGPVRATAVFVLCTALGVFAFRSPLAGGLLLLAASAVPTVLGASAGGAFPLGGAFPHGSLVAVALPASVIGLLYLAASVTTAAPATAVAVARAGRAVRRSPDRRS